MAEDLVVGRGVTIPATEIDERFTTSGGPGGQHANRAHTRVELRFDIVESSALSEHQRHVLTERFGPELRVVVDEERSQVRNRAIARERLAARLNAALTPRRPRRPTRPTRGSQVRRLDSKRRRSAVKRDRRRPDSTE